MSTVTLDPDFRRRVTTALAAVPSLLAELDVTISRSDVVAASRALGNVRASNAEQALAFHAGAAKARQGLLVVLAAFGELVASIVGQSPPDGPVEQARFVRTYLPDASDSAKLTDVGGSLVAAIQLGYRMIDHPDSRIRVGSCTCGVSLFAATDVDIVRCADCGATVSVRQRRQQLMSRAYEFMGTAAELARVLPDYADRSITADRIRQWARRGWLVGRVAGPNTVYRLGDVIEICSGRDDDLRRSA